MEDPIIITGTGRSGSTFLQWFLSSHPDIHISGEETLPWRAMMQFYEQLSKAGKTGGQFNETTRKNDREIFNFKPDWEKYRVPHWCGSDEERTNRIFRKMMNEFITGYGKKSRRWGFKSVWRCDDPELAEKFFERLFPNVKWVIACRHPFRSYESEVNNDHPYKDLTHWLRGWVRNIHFASKENAVLVQVDKMRDASHDQRTECLQRVLDFVGEKSTPETEQFIKDWPVVNKEKPDNVRRFMVDKEIKNEKIAFFPHLKEYMSILNYK